MLYSEYMDKVKEFALIKNEKTGLTYIRPDYEYVLANDNLKLGDVSDFVGVTRENVLEQLKLERDMRNAQQDKAPIVMNWLFDIITNIADPAMIEAENQLVKDMLEYQKEKNAIDERTKKLDEQEAKLEEKGKILPFHAGMSFSKKKP